MKTLNQHNAEVEAKRQMPKQYPAGVICDFCSCGKEMVYRDDNDLLEKNRIVVCPTGHKQGVKKS